MFLEPWIGKNYEKGVNKQKILILGESHYSQTYFDNSIEKSDFTIKVTEDIVTNKKKIKFFETIGRLFNDDWTEIWDNIAFANLIQNVFYNPSDQPSKEQISTVTSFYNYIDLLKPNKVIVCSRRAWCDWFEMHVDNKRNLSIDKSANIGISNVFKYPHSDGNSLAIGINHPSDRNTPNIESYLSKWKDHIDQFLKY